MKQRANDFIDTLVDQSEPVDIKSTIESEPEPTHPPEWTETVDMEAVEAQVAKLSGVTDTEG